VLHPRDCYAILGLRPGATLSEVKKAYRRLVKEWHPDRYAHDAERRRHAERVLKTVNLAYESLEKFLRFRPPYRILDPYSWEEPAPRPRSRPHGVVRWRPFLWRPRLRDLSFVLGYFRTSCGWTMGRALAVVGLGACPFVVVVGFDLLAPPSVKKLILWLGPGQGELVGFLGWIVFLLLFNVVDKIRDRRARW
jgi:hypothetical protein